MGFCFVIQPFDAPNDKRFEDVFVPAIEAAQLEPYRVDRDPGASVLIEEIEERIRSCDACLADITTDNPNVWYELGYALARNKVVVLVAADSRERYPFDIAQRRVIKYKAESPRDFEQLRERIATQLKGSLERRATMEDVASQPPGAPQAGLNAQQLAALVSIAQAHDELSGLSAYQLRQEMASVGFTDIATTIAVRGLMRMKLVSSYVEQEQGDPFSMYRATEAGLDWLEENQDKLSLRRDAQQLQITRADLVPDGDTSLDDLPF